MPAVSRQMYVRFMARHLRYTKEMLQQAAITADSVADVLHHLDLQQAGGTHAHISRLLRAYDIDTSHFTRRKRQRMRTPRGRPEDLLVRRKPGSTRVNGQRLRRALLVLGRPHLCEVCGLRPDWQGKRLVLQVDHIDGDLNNNAAGNLRFLCPNCHSQSPTFSRRPWATRRTAS